VLKAPNHLAFSCWVSTYLWCSWRLQDFSSFYTLGPLISAQLHQNHHADDIQTFLSVSKLLILMRWFETNTIICCLHNGCHLYSSRSIYLKLSFVLLVFYRNWQSSKIFHLIGHTRVEGSEWHKLKKWVNHVPASPSLSNHLPHHLRSTDSYTVSNPI